MLKIVIFHIGSIGDTIMAVPALNVIRNNYPDAHITLLLSGGGKAGCAGLLNNSGLVDEFLEYNISGNIIKRLFKIFGLMLILRRKRFDLLIYLRRNQRDFSRFKIRDQKIFKSCGIKKILGCSIDCTLPSAGSPECYKKYPTHAQLLLERLNADGIVSPGKLNFDLHLTAEELDAGEVFARRLKEISGEKIPVVFGLGGSRQVQFYPAEKWCAVLTELEKSSVFPLFFGGAKDECAVRAMLQKVQNGCWYGDIMPLNLRETVAAMSKCRCYIGHDTGTMHMAVAAGIPCVAVFSSVACRGVWDPETPKSIVLRTENLSCRGCELTKCTYGDPAKCIDAIEPSEVVDAVKRLLGL